MEICWKTSQSFLKNILLSQKSLLGWSKKIYWNWRKKGGEHEYMGQYFIAVNKTKKEYIRSWDIGGVAKLWEWCVNRQAGIFPYLLRKSNEGGGGDIQIENPKFAGRWAGDKVYLVGDYDKSNLYEKAQAEYQNIAEEFAKEYNEFIKLDDCKLEVKAA